MRKVNEWFADQKRRREGLPSLELALLGNGGLRYGWYRLKYVLLRAVLRTTLRLAEVWLFATAFSMDILGPVLLMRSLTLLSAAGWWGALERLRSDVRGLGQEKRLVEISQSVERWLGIGASLGGIVLCLSIGYVLLGLSPFDSFSVVDVYVLGCGIRLTADLLVRAYHSGVYGLRRVYRPLWSLLTVDLADVLVLALLWLLIGPWAMGLSLGVVGLLRAGLSSHFSKRTYRQLNIQVGGPVRWVQALVRRLGKPVLRERTGSPTPHVPSISKLAAANIVGQLDGLLVILLLTLKSADFLLLASLLHVVGPLQNSAFGWTRLFYFDFKRLEVWNAPVLNARFDRFLRRAAYLAPLPAGLITALLLKFFWQGPYLELACLLLSLGWVRAWLALIHLKAFVHNDYPALFRILSLFAALFVGLLSFPPEQESTVLYTILGGLALIVALELSVQRLRPRAVPARKNQYAMRLTAWLQTLAQAPHPVRVGWLEVERTLAKRQAVLRTLFDQTPHVHISSVGPRSAVWFQTTDAPTYAELVRGAAGTTHRLHLTEILPSGREALTRLKAAELSALDSLLSAVPRTASRHSISTPGPQELEDQLRAIVPSARVHALCAGAPPLPEASAVSARDLTRALLAALGGRDGFQRFEEAEIVIVAPQTASPLAAIVPRGSGREDNWRARSLTAVRRFELTNYELQA